MPIEVVGESANGKAFREVTHTTVVNAHGALLLVTIATEIKPAILIINKKTSAEVRCRVVFQKRVQSGKAELGVEFVDPQPRFWGISFPPEDWTWAERKKPGPAAK